MMIIIITFMQTGAEQVAGTDDAKQAFSVDVGVL